MNFKFFLIAYRKCIYAFFIAFVFSTAFAIKANTQSTNAKPNIVFIIADDLGYGNLTAYNAKSKIATPRIDAFEKLSWLLLA